MMVTLKVVDKNGKKVGELTVAEGLVKARVSPQLIHDVVVGYLRNMRQGTVSTKSRGEITASGKKPWRQKGTGRARAGSRSSPIWRGGGVAFGPKPRDFRKTIPKALRRKALASALSVKLREGDVIVVDRIEGETGKTKQMAAWLARIGAVEKPLVVLKERGGTAERALRNIAGVSLVTASGLNAYLLLAHGKLVISREDFEAVQERVI